MQRRATTLVEILIYFVLLAIVLTVAMNFSLQLLQAYGVTKHAYELETTTEFLMGKISATVQSAESVNEGLSAFEVAEGSLALNMPEGLSPVRYYLSQGQLYYVEGTGDPTAITPQHIWMNTFTIERIVSPKTPDHLRIEGNLTMADTDIQILKKEQNFNLSLSLRSR